MKIVVLFLAAVVFFALIDAIFGGKKDTATSTAPAPAPVTAAQDPAAHSEGPKFSDASGFFNGGGAAGIGFQATVADDSAGLDVISVDPDSAAQKGDLRKGDVIKAAGGRSTTSIESLSEIISSYPSGTHLELSVLRGGQNKTLDVYIP